ncbi:MAG: amidohydrolase family protein, partial [Maritimibacter sp.]|nr:amidohydrolase family protein [Maritimibacter sp.]
TTSLGEDHTANPARALGLEGQVGTIRPGSRASCTCLTQDLDVTAVMVEGQILDR